DRLAYRFLKDDEREMFINALGQRFADHLQDNLSDLGGLRNYRNAFVSLLNDRLDDYSTLNFEEGEPGFDVLRYLGNKILGVLGEDQTNRWVLDQIVAVEAPEIAEKIKKSVFNLLSAQEGDDD
ncbi:MAG TPA: hypothetical protein VIT83_04650, partial [Gammaproteobacteria bacterium]